MSDTVIDIRGVGKRFRISREASRTVKEAAIRFLKRQVRYDDFWALRDISLSINRGESVGIIGRNGSGKSTLFKLISGVLRPTEGSIKVSGRISPMIELAAGFHPELTGIENIYLNCAIYGMSKAEVRGKLDAILDFADIGEFVHSPVRTYSSGMLARLGFAVAVNVDADILLIDEVLAVGDGEFQERCYARLRELKNGGITFIFVSHDLNALENICERALWIADGRMQDDSNASKVINAYRNSL